MTMPIEFSGNLGKDGKLIAFMGLPASGKSSTVRALSLMLDASVFLEPEEDLWADAVLKRDLSGYFTAVTWFRSMRVPQLYLANGLRVQGQTVFVDSYYDKLIYYYLGKPGMDWLISPDDKYYAAMKLITELDYKYLPNADCIVFLRLSMDNWRELVHRRNRQLDNDQMFLRSFATQDYFLEAAQEYVRSTGATLIIHDQAISSPTVEAQRIYNSLRAKGILDKEEMF